MDGKVSAASYWRPTDHPIDMQDAKRRDHVRWSCKSNGGRYPARINSFSTVVQHLPALCVGPVVQSQSPETGTESEEVCRLGTKGADCAEERRDAASGYGTHYRAPELLCHHGQLETM